MATTVNDILVEALPRSGRNRPGAIANDAIELRNVVGRSLRALFCAGARRNPAYFSMQSAVIGVAGIWTRPARAEAVWRVEAGAGDECVILPYAERSTAYGKPRLYRMGRTYVTGGATGDPGATDTLTFTYAVTPLLPTTTTEDLDPLWPESFNPLLVEEVALYLAIKDGRDAEVATLKPERDQWLQLFFAHLDHETMNEQHVFHPPRLSELAVVPLAGAPMTNA